MRFKLLLLLVTLQLSGCHHRCACPNLDPNHGLTIVLPGIEGESFLNRNIVQGLRNGQVRGEIEIFDWTSGNPLRSLEHLRDRQRVAEQGQQLANYIAQARALNQVKPISLVAHSGGAGVVLEALGRIPPWEKVDSVVLIAPAVSRNVPVDQIAERSRLGIWSFNSPFDVQLTAGTTLFGTVDGINAPAAGSYGFQSYSPRVHQFTWGPEMLVDGHPGGHLGPTNQRFVKNWISPIVRQAQRASR